MNDLNIVSEAAYLKELRKDKIKLKEVDNELIDFISNYESRNLIKKIYATRFKDKDLIKEYLTLTFKDLISTTRLKNIIDIDKLYESILESIKNKRWILVYSDSDADGVISAAIFYKFFKRIFNYDKIIIKVNNFRRSIGNGLNHKVIENIEELQDKYNFNLVIFTDHGSNNYEEIKYLKEKYKFKTAIIDHHIYLDNEFPNEYLDIFINTQNKKQDDFKMLSAAALSYFCLSYIYLNMYKNKDFKKGYFTKDKLTYLYYLSTYAGLSIISDAMSLKDPINRILVNRALFYLNNSETIQDTFWKSVIDFLNNQSYINEKTLSFGLIPYINSAGRLDKPELSYKLLIEDNESNIINRFRELEKTNNIRIDLQNKAYEDESNIVISNKVLCVMYSKNSKGVQGILASKLLLEKGYKIVFVFSDDKDNENYLSGSARSIENDINLKSILDKLNKNTDLIIKYGGHKNAVGIKIKNNLQDFFNKFNKLLNKYKIKRDKYIEIDDIIYSNKKLILTINDIKRAGPYGVDFEEPKFVSDLIIKTFKITKKNSKYNLILGCKLSSISNFTISLFYSFNKNDLDKINESLYKYKKIRAVYTIDTNTYFNIDKIYLNASYIKFIDTSV